MYSHAPAIMLMLEPALGVLLLLEHIAYHGYSVFRHHEGREERFCFRSAALRQSHGMYTTVPHMDHMLSACRFVGRVMSVRLQLVEPVGSLLATPCAFLAP